MTGVAPDLIAACWTSAGNVVPFRTGPLSPLDVLTRIRAVAEAGYTGFGLTREDLVVARETVGLGTVASALRDHGITTVQLERLTDWWADGERRRAADAARKDLFEACPALGVDNIKVGADDEGAPIEYGPFCEAFDALADDAARAGVKIGFENTPFSYRIRTTEEAIALVTEVGNPNAGVVLDIWHAYRGGSDYQVIADTLPLAHLFGVELDDGDAEPVGTLLEDTFDRRRPCGEGDFDVAAFILAVRDIGWTGPWGVEDMSVTSRSLPVTDALVRARDAALASFAEADRRAGPVSGQVPS
ncbi:Sugar phosphate isomerase/epimerase [Friedmanniella luteola]|uniref:Sugar phosphate isomerase/epimerase n=1 Tax=Friedmanniella luteola TaxID=546871 RepID=A0A1H1LA34_9ACTN|nr:sugar phosphate isomerase/epimerase family protein [Friedmanniella luteola]SDR70729.1 Sugar phosphate isomerase/epimerase [Friedmanniella luteola]